MRRHSTYGAIDREPFDGLDERFAVTGTEENCSG